MGGNGVFSTRYFQTHICRVDHNNAVFFAMLIRGGGWIDTNFSAVICVEFPISQAFIPYFILQKKKLDYPRWTLSTRAENRDEPTRKNCVRELSSPAFVILIVCDDNMRISNHFYYKIVFYANFEPIMTAARISDVSNKFSVSLEIKIKWFKIVTQSKVVSPTDRECGRRERESERLSISRTSLSHSLDRYHHNLISLFSHLIHSAHTYRWRFVVSMHDKENRLYITRLYQVEYNHI